MTDRTVVYRLRAEVGQLRAQMAQAGASVKKFGDDLTGLNAKGEKMRAGLTDLGNTSGKVALALGAGYAVAVTKAANFEQAMSYVQAATHESAQSMDLLRQAALDAGADTAFSATEAAGAVEELAKAGVSTAEILGGGLQGALDLAAAGGLDVASAAEAAASAMTQFKLSGEDVPHIADLLAAGAGKAQGEVSDMAAALNQSGLVAAQTGLTIEETTGALSAMASAGLVGSDAGTALKSALQSLTPTSKESAKLMERLGITAYDAQGNFVGLAEFASSLRKGLKDLSAEQRNAALKTIFGSDAVRAAAVMYEQGGKGIQSWIDQTNDAGYAADTAAIRMDNLKGDLEQLGGALETAFINGGSGQTGMLRELTQGVTGLVDAFNDLPAGAQQATTALTGLGALGAGGFWFTSKAVTSIADTRQALVDLGLRSADTEKKLSTLGIASRGIAGAAGLGLIVHGATQADDALGGLELAAGGALTGFAVGGPLGAAVGGTAGALWGLVSAADGASEAAIISRTNWEDYRSTLDDVTAATTRATKSMVVQDLQASGLLKQATDMGIDPQLLVNGILGQGKAREKLAAALAAQKEELTELGKAEYEKHKDDKKWDREVADDLQRRWDTIDAIETETGELREAAKARIEEIALINGLPEEVVTEFVTNAPETAAQVAVLAEQYDLTPKQIKTVLDLLGINATMADIKKAQKALRETDGIHANPTIGVDISTALAGVRTLKAELAGIGNPKVNTTGTSEGLFGGKPKKKATGGLILGPGGPTDDLIPALLSNREYVINAAAVDEYGVSFFDALNARRLDPDSALERYFRGFAAGGHAAGSGAYYALATGGQPGKTGKPRKNESYLGFFPEVGLGLNAFIKSLEASKDALDDELSARKSVAESLASSITGKFTSDLFGNTDIWSGGGSLDDAIATLQGDIAGSQAFQSDIATLQSKGLTGDALSALLTQADPATVANIAATASADSLAQYSQLYGQRIEVNAATAAAAQMAAGYTETIAALQAKVDQTNAHLAELTRLQQGAPAATGKAAGRETSKSNNKGAAKSQLNRRRG